MEAQISSELSSLAADTALQLLSRAGSRKTLDPGMRQRLASLADQGNVKRENVGRLLQHIRTKGTHGQPGFAAQLTEFLRGEAGSALVRQLYALLLTHPKNPRLQTLRSAFSALYSLQFGVPEDDALETADIVIVALRDQCDSVLETPYLHGQFGPELIALPRSRVIAAEAESPILLMQTLAQRHGAPLSGIGAFAARLRREIAYRHSMITPPDFYSSRQVPIDELYVEPSFAAVSSTNDSDSGDIHFAGLLSTTFRRVILGNPGSGKSTLTAKICYELSEHGDHLHTWHLPRLVVPIVLRDYATARRDHHWSIVDFMVAYASNHCHVPVPPQAFSYLLSVGSILTIFDGLDELVQLSDRRQLALDIESFSRQYPSSPILVTSREVGYDQAPLSKEAFDVFTISPFDDHQVEEYVRRWFVSDPDISQQQAEKKSQSFIEDSRTSADLRSNPLMLSLMCNMYKGTNQVPQSRPDLYEQCSLLLFRRWDKMRGILVSLPFEAHLMPALKYLAAWIYSDQNLQHGVREAQLLAKTADYLETWRYDSRADAEEAAAAFVEFCRGRAWVFTDIGSDETVGWYQFTHRTFLEYFAAAHLVRTNPSPEALLDVLLPHIDRGEWDVVVQLAFQLLNNNVEGAADQVLQALTQRPSEGLSQVALERRLGLAVRSLSFLVPRPAALRTITRRCVEELLDSSERRETNRDPNHRGAVGSRWGQAVTNLRNLLTCAQENRATVADELGRVASERASAGGGLMASMAVELVVGLPGLTANTAVRAHQDPGARGFWREAAKRCWEETDSASDIVSTDVAVALHAMWEGLISPNDVVQAHGLQAFYREAPFRVFMGGRRPAAEIVLRSVMRRVLPTTHVRFLKEFGDAAATAPTPWLRRRNVQLSDVIGRISEETSEERIIKRFDALLTDIPTAFGLLCLLAPYYERSAAGRGVPQLVGILLPPHHLSTNWMKTLLEARRRRPAEIIVVEALNQAGLEGQRRDFVTRWINRDVDLLEQEA